MKIVSHKGLWLVAIVGLGALCRLPGQNRSLGHDEVFTWTEYAGQSWSKILSTYTANNHIFHSLCVKGSTGVWGTAEWAMRLPALLAGVLGIALVFFLARALAQSLPVAVLSSLLMALVPAHMHHSQHARGYTLMMLWSMGCALGALRAVGAAGDRVWAGWAASVLCGFLAVFTIPSATYLVAAVFAWAGGVLALQYANADLPAERLARRRDLVRWAVASLALAGLLLAVYGPIYDQVALQSRRWGIDLHADPAAGREIAAGIWRALGPVRWPLWGGIKAALGLLELVRRNRRRGALVLAVLAVPLALNVATGLAGPSRVYLFALPFVLILIASGVVGVAERVGAWERVGRFRGRRVVLVLAAGVTLASYASLEALRGAQDTGYRDMGQLVARQAGTGDVPVFPYIMDLVLDHYSDDVRSARIGALFGSGDLNRLLLVARNDAPRFSLADYMLTANFTTAEGGHRDEYFVLQMPESGFEKVGGVGELGMYRAEVQRVWDRDRLWQPQAWRVYYSTAPERVKLRGEEGEIKRLHVGAGAGSTSVLHSVRRYRAPAAGLIVLRYAKSAGEGVYASLYEAAAEAGNEGLRAKQMAKVLTTALVVDEDQKQNRRFGELYLAPMEKDRYYGVYIFASGVPEQYFSDWGVWYIPFD